MLYRDYGKRMLDVAGSAIGLILAAPIIAVAGVAIAGTMGRPIFYRQLRAGRGGRAIRVLKLRTMTNAVDGEGKALPDRDRISGVGRVLRRWSIDELPQLWNVLRGEMSLIGPRPLLVRYDPFYTDLERRRFTVRPGISGWAQVNGRNDSPWDERLRHDIWYVDHLSLGLDLRIATLTVRRLVSGQGVRVDPRSSIGDLDEVRSRSSLV